MRTHSNTEWGRGPTRWTRLLGPGLSLVTILEEFYARGEHVYKKGHGVSGVRERRYRPRDLLSILDRIPEECFGALPVTLSMLQFMVGRPLYVRIEPQACLCRLY